MANLEKAPQRLTMKDGEVLTPLQLRAHIQDAQVKDIVSVKFMELLLASRKLSLSDTADFVNRAAAARASLMAYSVMDKILTEDELAETYARLHRIPLLKGPLQTTGPVVGRIDLAHAQRLGAFPVAVENGKLVVAISDPSKPGVQQELEKIVAGPVELRVASSERIRSALIAVERASDTSDARLRSEMQSETVQVDMRAGGDSSAITVLADALIAQAREQGASDIHIEPGDGNTRVRYRIDGVLTEARVIPRAVHDNLVTRVKVISDMKIDERRSPQDGRATVTFANGGSIELRVATLPTVHGERVTMRLLDPSQSMLGLNELGLNGPNLELVQRAVERPHGLCITTGPTGSGKSTTLYSMMHMLNDTSRNVITVEDPVEQQVPGLNQVQTNERAGMTFASALRSILRSDPDVIMIGEIRDFETAKIAVESAMTGHLVLSTLHTNSAAAAIGRLSEMGVEPFLIADACHLIIAQRLARTLCQFCRVSRAVDQQMLHTARAPQWVMEKLGNDGALEMFAASADGCPRCRNTGYRGRVGLHEVMEITPELSHLIINGNNADSIAVEAIRNGMHTLRDDGYIKILRGVTSIEEVSRVTTV